MATIKGYKTLIISILLFTVLFLLISIFQNYGYNFVSLDGKVYDEFNSKTSEGEVQPSFELNQKLLSFFTNSIDWLSRFKTIIIPFFLASIILGVFIGRKTGILPMMKDFLTK